MTNDLMELYLRENAKQTNYVYINNCGNVYKKITFNDDARITDILKENDCLFDEPKIYQTKNKILDLENTFSFYNIQNEDVIYVLPPPAPLPYLIYLHHEKLGKVHFVELNHTDSVKYLQKHIEKWLKIKEEDQILIYEGKPLSNKKTLEEENLKRESVILIIDKKDIPQIEEESEYMDSK